MGEFDTCMLCPRLCRSACPVVTGAGREAATPTWIATVLREWEAGRCSEEMARQAATLCTDCGACQDHCHLDRPLPELIRRARSTLSPPPPLPLLAPPDGPLLIVADDRDWSAALQHLPGFTAWRTPERLGLAGLEAGGRHPAESIAALASRELVTPDGGILRALRLSGLHGIWLHDRLGLAPARGSCQLDADRPLACCGGAGPLAAHHPDDARRVAGTWVDRGGLQVGDARCREHLHRCGHAAVDVLDALRTGGP